MADLKVKLIILLLGVFFGYSINHIQISRTASISARALATKPPSKDQGLLFGFIKPDAFERLVIKSEGPMLPADGEYTIADVIGTGYMSKVFMSFNSKSEQTRRTSRLQMFIDDETLPSVDVSFEDLTCARGVEGYRISDKFGFMGSVDLASGGGTSFYFNFVAPFRKHLVVKIKNSSSAPAILGGFVEYGLGDISGFGKYGKLRSHTINNLKVPAYSWETLFDTTIEKGGLYTGMYLYFEGGDLNYDYLEGNFRFYIDGSQFPTIEYDSTEDYFQNAWYFAAKERLSKFVGTTSMDSISSVGTYRFQDQDPFSFKRQLKIKWQAGERRATPVKRDTTINGVIWYYETQ